MRKGEYKDFAYTGSVQAWEVPNTGIYKLEVWGSRGDSTGGGAWQPQGTTGLGGYSIGYKKLKKGETIYIVCGGVSFNGGGARYGYNHDFGEFYHWVQINAGGGATHIAKISGTLAVIGKALFDSQGLIVAGGGAGRPWNVNSKSGSGGGTSGSNSNVGSDGGSQTSGNAFGQGGAGAGGGYYGGRLTNIEGAGGGSGWIDGVEDFQTEKKSTLVGVNNGTGKAKITLVKTLDIKLGNLDVETIYCGNKEVDALYLGNIEL